MIKRLCVIGVGLIGGSLARALRAAGFVDEVIGCGRSAENLERALALDVIDAYALDPAAAVEGADVVVVASALAASAEIFTVIAPAIRADCVVTDVGSAKSQIVAAARRAFGDKFPRFVPGHPIAGTEKSGVDASFDSLFDDHRVILTPVEETAVDALAAVADMWRATGARVVEMDVARHDAVLAATSHLPHMLAYALVDCLASVDDADEIFANAAGGFRDFSRIASSNPAMWCEIALDNRAELLRMLDRFSTTFNALREALSRQDREALIDMFNRAKATRDRIVLPDVK